MIYAILAAGEGSRLAEEGCEVPKPLVRIQGETLIGRLIRVYIANGATRIVVITNEQHTATADYLRGLTLPVPLDIVVQSTPSSMHSLYAIRDYLATDKMLTKEHTQHRRFYGIFLGNSCKLKSWGVWTDVKNEP